MRISKHESTWEKEEKWQKDNHIIRKEDTGSSDTTNLDTNMKDIQNMKNDGHDKTRDMTLDTKSKNRGEDSRDSNRSRNTEYE